jgi:hypothetical protein
MLANYTPYQQEGLKELVRFRKRFLQEESSNKHYKRPTNKKTKTLLLKEESERFIEVFCQHNFANSDYTVLQSEPKLFDSIEEWINQSPIETILKYLTYLIWTDKIIEGFLLKKIKDQTVKMFLDRLDTIIKNGVLQPLTIQRAFEEDAELESR